MSRWQLRRELYTILFFIFRVFERGRECRLLAHLRCRGASEAVASRAASGRAIAGHRCATRTTASIGITLTI